MRTGKELDRYESVIFQPQDVWQLSDPASLKVNGISLEEVSQGKEAGVVSMEITNLFQRNNIRRGSAVFICQNPSFDRIFFSQLIDPDVQESLKWPYYWLDLASMYWAESMRVGKQNPHKLPWETGFSKDKIAAVYQLPSEVNP